LSLHLVDLARDKLLEFADIGRELANTFRALLSSLRRAARLNAILALVAEDKAS
jgi:hypothetical protein